MTPRYFELLRTLSNGDVEFVVVGGVAAILEGAPITTLDLDVVVATGAANLDRLAEILASIDARKEAANREGTGPCCRSCAGPWSWRERNEGSPVRRRAAPDGAVK